MFCSKGYSSLKAKRHHFGGIILKYFKKLDSKIAIAILTALSALFLTIILNQFYNIELDIPISNWGGDDTWTYKNAKTIADTGWLFYNPYLGAPFDTNYLGFPVMTTCNFDYFILKLLILLTGDYIVALNLQYILLFPLIAIISYFVMLQLNINKYLAYCGSLAYSFTPYIFSRGILHLNLSQYQFVPLTILICFWLRQDDYFVINKKFFKNYKNIATLIFIILLSNNGEAYYPFFSCFFIIAVGIIRSLNTLKIKDFFKSLAIVLLIAFCLLGTLIPTFMNPQTNAAIRGIGDAEVYGLKIIQLLLPNKVYDIPAIDNITSRYTTNFPLINENYCSFLGIVGSVGFIILICCLFIKPHLVKNLRYLRQLADLNIVAILLGTIGGLGSIIALLITPMIRGYNRISIFISYFSILAVLIIFEYLLEKFKKKKIIILGILFLFTLNFLERTPVHNIDYDLGKSEYYSDKDFVEMIEASVSENAMIYQMPYHGSLGSGNTNNMKEYDLLKGYLYSDTLRWSHGGMTGSNADLWNKELASKSTIDRIKILSILEFEGIYIDRRAYTSEEITQLELELNQLLNIAPIYSNNGNLEFYNMNDFNKTYKKLYTKDEWIHMQNGVLDCLNWKNGAYDIEHNEHCEQRWLESTAELLINVNGNYATTREIEFTISTPTSENNSMTMEVNGIVYCYNLSSEPINIKETLLLNPGENTIKLHTDAKKIDTPDSRNLYMLLTNFKWNVLSLK